MVRELVAAGAYAHLLILLLFALAAKKSAPRENLKSWFCIKGMNNRTNWDQVIFAKSSISSNNKGCFLSQTTQ